MKIILHIDFNSFFASVEQQANPFLRGRAIAVAGKGKESIDVSATHAQRKRVNVDTLRHSRSVITTASREAKAQGVKTAMATHEARKLAPSLLIIPGDPRKYSEITARMMTVLRTYADAVEQFSTDEAFADITTACGGDYFGATLLGEVIREKIADACGEYCTASIGIASNRLLAKLASESAKPNGFTVVPPEDAERFVASRPLKEFCGIGFRTEKHLADMGITSVATLREVPLERLLLTFKSYGQFLYDAARGRGSDLVESSEDEPKSIGHSYTFPYNIFEEHEVRQQLLALADRVSWRMRKQGLAGTHISVYARYGSFDGIGRGKQLREPITDGLAILENATALLLPELRLMDGVRLLGVSMSGFVKQGAISLLPKERKTELALRSLDHITEKYGSGTWQRASTMNTLFKERVSGWHYDHEV